VTAYLFVVKALLFLQDNVDSVDLLCFEPGDDGEDSQVSKQDAHESKALLWKGYYHKCLEEVRPYYIQNATAYKTSCKI